MIWCPNVPGSSTIAGWVHESPSVDVDMTMRPSHVSGSGRFAENARADHAR